MMFRKSILLSVLFLFGIASVPVSAADTKTLRFSWWGPESRHVVTLKAVKIYESRNPGIKIVGEYMDFGGYLERLVMQFSGGNQPDIMQVNWAWVETIFSKNGGNFYDMYKAKQFLRLEEFEGREKDGVVNGHLNALPVSYTIRTLLWQKRTFDKAGLRIPKTWDDIFTSGKVFSTKLGADYYPLVGASLDVQLLVFSWAHQKFGKPMIDYNTKTVAYTKAQMKEVLLFYKKLKEGHVISPTPVHVEQTFLGRDPDWVSGKWAGGYKWETEAAIYLNPLKNAVVEVGEFPQIPGTKENTSFSHPAFMYAVSTRCKYPEEAVNFLNFLLTDPEAVKVQGGSRGISAVRSAMNQQVRDNSLSPIQIKVMNLMKKNPPAKHSPWFEHIHVSEYIYRTFSSYIEGQINEDEAARRLVDEVNQILRTIR
jgi:oligogalacturonide transport system substrate-binding protein